MWLLFHRNSKARVVRGGEQFVQDCPSCHSNARFFEVEVEENVGVWFVDIVGDTSRAFKCGACGDVFDAKGKPATKTEPPTTAREIERDREIRALEAELARREAERAAEARKEAAEAKANQIEDELALLKKRVGRD